MFRPRRGEDRKRECEGASLSCQASPGTARRTAQDAQRLDEGGRWPIQICFVPPAETYWVLPREYLVLPGLRGSAAGTIGEEKGSARGSG